MCKAKDGTTRILLAGRGHKWNSKIKLVVGGLDGTKSCARSWTWVGYSFLVPNQNGENVSEIVLLQTRKKRVFSVILHGREASKT
jgi:hypothetical protein